MTIFVNPFISTAPTYSTSTVGDDGFITSVEDEREGFKIPFTDTVVDLSRAAKLAL